MNKIISEISINKVESSSKYLLKVGNRNYYIGELIYFIISRLQEEKTDKEICEEVNGKFTQEDSLNEYDIRKIIEDNIRPLGVFDKEAVQDKINSPIAGKIKLLGEKTITTLCKPIKFLFNPVLFTIFFIAAATFNIYFMFLNNDILTKISIQNIEHEIWFIILFYPSIILIFLLHEFGHAASTLKFDALPKSIGCGFYFLIPVLYTDVTDIWKLAKEKRIIINLAGIYIQLILNIFLFILSLFISNKSVNSFILYLILINTSTFVINLLPFIKYDAYWLYSDLTSNPNLKSRSRNFLYQLFLGAFKKNKIPLKDYKLSIIIYSLLSMAFFIWLYYKILVRFYYEIVQIKITWMIIRNMSLTVQSVTYLLIVLLTLIFGIAIIYSFLRIMYRYIHLLFQ